MNKAIYPSLICILLFGIGTTPILMKNTARQEQSQLICSTNESALSRDDGWRQLPEADRLDIGWRVRQKTAEIEYRPGSLICAYWQDEKLLKRITDAGLWYWRPIKQPKE